MLSALDNHIAMATCYVGGLYGFVREQTFRKGFRNSNGSLF